MSLLHAFNCFHFHVCNIIGYSKKTDTALSVKKLFKEGELTPDMQTAPPRKFKQTREEVGLRFIEHYLHD